MHFSNKKSFRDGLPFPVLKQVASEISPLLVHLFNLSLLTGVFTSQFKTSFTTPLIKKPGVVPNDFHS